MTLVFDGKLGNDVPQTHALIIGAGTYPHLPGGNLAEEDPAPKNFGLKQLTSTLVSAAALSDWLLTRHRNEAAPLGSIELLLAPGLYRPAPAAADKLAQAAGAAAIPVDEPTFDAVEAAFGRWFIRANRQAANVALFYFGGHGLEATDRYLLASDFGSNPLDWQKGLINFGVTYHRMKKCRAKTQCFFLDACRDRSQELSEAAAQGPVGRPLIGDQPGDVQQRNASIYHGASEGMSALGPPGDKSYFADALIRCLDGMGAADQAGDDEWVIQIESLGQALREFMGRKTQETGRDLSCSVETEASDTESAAINMASGPVDVMTIISCSSQAPCDEAELALVNEETAERVERRSSGGGSWRSVVKAGTWKIQARFEADSQFRNVERSEIVMPPVCVRLLKILPK